MNKSAVRDLTVLCAMFLVLMAMVFTSEKPEDKPQPQIKVCLEWDAKDGHKISIEHKQVNRANIKKLALMKGFPARIVNCDTGAAL